MNVWDILILGAVAAVPFLVSRLRKTRSGCCGGCEGCSGCSSCPGAAQCRNRGSGEKSEGPREGGSE